MCKTTLGKAQIENSPDTDTKTLNNINREREILAAGGVTVNEGCLQFIIFSECVSTVQPCAGTVWCGEESKAQLFDKAEEMCMCAGTAMCQTTIFGFLTRVNVATTYTQSSAAQAGTCQVVQLGETPAS